MTEQYKTSLLELRDNINILYDVFQKLSGDLIKNVASNEDSPVSYLMKAHKQLIARLTANIENINHIGCNIDEFIKDINHINWDELSDERKDAILSKAIGDR
jgi:hypothetical protein